MKKCLIIGYSLLLLFATPQTSLASDAVTLVFREGHVAYINNGYKQLAEAFKNLNRQSQDHQIVELAIEGESFLINVAEVVVVCRDRCTSLEIVDQRQPKK